MSAEKCGSELRFDTGTTLDFVVNKTGAQVPVVVSGKALDILRAIRTVHPDWSPKSKEAEVWSKARSLGLLDDESLD